MFDLLIESTKPYEAIWALSLVCFLVFYIFLIDYCSIAHHKFSRELR